MTDGATLLSATFHRFPCCGSRFPTTRCAFRGPPPRSEFKLALRVVSPTRAINRVVRRGGVVDRSRTLHQTSITLTSNRSVWPSPGHVKPPSPGVCRLSPPEAITAAYYAGAALASTCVYAERCSLLEVSQSLAVAASPEQAAPHLGEPIARQPEPKPRTHLRHPFCGR